MTTKRSTAVLLVLVLTGGAAALALAGTFDPANRPAITNTAARGSDSKGHPGAHLALLGRFGTRVQAAAVSAELAPFSRVATTTSGPDLAAARKAFEVPGGPKVFAAPGQSPGQVFQITLLPVQPGPGVPPEVVGKNWMASGSVSNGWFNERGLIAVSGSPPNAWVTGLVPDGVARVTVTFAGGSSVDAEVRNNAFAVHATAPTVSVSFDGSSGRVTEPARSFPVDG